MAYGRGQRVDGIWQRAEEPRGRKAEGQRDREAEFQRCRDAER